MKLDIHRIGNKYPYNIKFTVEFDNGGKNEQEYMVTDGRIYNQFKDLRHREPGKAFNLLKDNYKPLVDIKIE